MKKCLLIFKTLFVILNFSFAISKAQFYNLPNDYYFSLFTERSLAAPDSSVHSAVKPYIHFYSNKYEHIIDSHRVFKFISDDPLIDKVFFEHLLNIKERENKYRFSIDPLLNAEIGRDDFDTTLRNLTTNTRGFIASGHVGKDFYFESMLAETQSFFPNYVADFNNQTLVVPGQGRYKKFKGNGYDYAWSSGFFSYQPCKNINVQAGHGKQKIGNGYRSLLLSDNAFNYPFVRLTQQWFKGRLQYTNIYAVLMNLDSASTKVPPGTERLFQKKAASFQQLSLNITKWLNLGFFQGMIWQAGDKTNTQHLEWQYFNPVIFTNLPQYGLNNKNNILTGADINIKLTKKFSLYAQIMADDLSDAIPGGNGFGYQAGFRYFDALKIKNLFLQAEFNTVTENSYNSPIPANGVNQSYSHYHQNLAFTPGYGKEAIAIADYKYKRFFFNARYNYQLYTYQNYDLFFNQIANFKLGYTVNPAYNFNVSLGVMYRAQDFFGFNASNNKTAYLYISFKTSLYNTYFDF